MALLEAPLPEVERRKPSKTDDADITDMKTSMVLLHMVQFFHNWLEPAVANTYGESGTSKLAAMWAEFSPQFQYDLKFAVKLKDRGSTHGELTLKQLPWIYPKLAGLTEEQSIQQQVQDSRQTTLDAWEAWHQAWATTKHSSGWSPSGNRTQTRDWRTIWNRQRRTTFKRQTLRRRLWKLGSRLRR